MMDNHGRHGKHGTMINQRENIIVGAGLAPALYRNWLTTDENK